MVLIKARDFKTSLVEYSLDVNDMSEKMDIFFRIKCKTTKWIILPSQHSVFHGEANPC